LNSATISNYFDDWRNKRGNFFDLLTLVTNLDDCSTGATTGTYRKQRFSNQVVNLTGARLSAPIDSRARHLGEWRYGHRTLGWSGDCRDGRPYQTPAWYFAFEAACR